MVSSVTGPATNAGPLESTTYRLVGQNPASLYREYKHDQIILTTYNPSATAKTFFRFVMDMRSKTGQRVHFIQTAC